MHAVFTWLFCQRAAYHVYPISTRSMGATMSWYRVVPTISPVPASRTAHGSMWPAFCPASASATYARGLARPGHGGEPQLPEISVGSGGGKTGLVPGFERLQPDPVPLE